MELFLDMGAFTLEIEKKELPFENVIAIVGDSFSIASDLESGELIDIDHSIFDRTTRQGEIKRALKYAIEHEQALVYFQPIMNSKTGKIEGAEALTRINDKDGNLVPPGLFIPIAEKNGMINQLGEQVFKKTCQFIKTYDVKNKGLSWINVNLSPIQFVRQNLAERLENYTREYDVDPGFIHLEITEEALIDENLLLRQMHALSSKGFKFVLDDYGKGYSNMTRLKKCPFINIKLDMSVVWDYCSQKDEIIPNLVNAFSKVGFGVTAEGIEDDDMAEKMSNVGVNYLQGYHYSKPLPLDEFVQKYLN